MAEPSRPESAEAEPESSEPKPLNPQEQEVREEEARREGYRTMGVGLELVGGVVAMAAVGWWIGGKYGNPQAGLAIGATIGFIGGLYNFIKSFIGKG